MLTHMGASIVSETGADGSLTVRITGRPELRPSSFLVPSDPSSAAFPAAAASVVEGSRVVVQGVCVNPLRIGLFTSLIEMGASITQENQRTVGGEIVADLVIEGGKLVGVEVPESRAPSMIDEYPVLSVVAALAHGTTRMRGLAELRVKESDRLATMAEGLHACGAAVEVDGDDLVVHGTGGRPLAGGVTIDAKLDHRIAMSFLVLGGIAAAPVTVLGAEAILTSFPSFVERMNGLGAKIMETAA
jgi:3-phosphoshikimate 1-carboxyvinyltransferase